MTWEDELGEVPEKQRNKATLNYSGDNGFDVGEGETDEFEDVLQRERDRKAGVLEGLLYVEKHNQERLDAMFGVNRSPSDPPESYERFERHLTMEHLSNAIWQLSCQSVSDDGHDEPDPTVSRVIDRLAAYGEEAVPYLTGLTRNRKIPVEHREHILDELEDIQRSQEATTLMDALRQWWGGGR